MNTSEWVGHMVEAGEKKFEIEVVPDETNKELRQRRNELHTELREARERIKVLEDKLYGRERREITKFVEENPGATEGEIQQRLIETENGQTADELRSLEGWKLIERDGEYYRMENE